jgi:hypothetical protein
MRRFPKVLQSRAVLVLGGAITSMLLLPVTASAGGFSGPRAGHHHAAAGGGSIELAIFIGILAVTLVSVLIISRFETSRRSGRRAANRIQRKPAGASS